MKSSYMNMRRAIAAAVAMFAATAIADPQSLKVKTAIVESPNGDTTEVQGGVYLNEDARIQVLGTLDAFKDQVDQMAQELKDANKKIADCTASVPGIPTWASAVISAVLTAATMAVGYLAINPPKWLK